MVILGLLALNTFAFERIADPRGQKILIYAQFYPSHQKKIKPVAIDLQNRGYNVSILQPKATDPTKRNKDYDGTGVTVIEVP